MGEDGWNEDINERLKSESESSPNPQEMRVQKQQENGDLKIPEEVLKPEIPAPTVLSSPSNLATSTPSGESSYEEQNQSQKMEPDEGVVLQDTSTELEHIQEPKALSPSSAKGSREKMLKAEPAISFVEPTDHSFEAFYQKQKSLPPMGHSTPKSRPVSREKGEDHYSFTGSAKSKDMDLDSVLDFDSKRLGEPDGAESGVVMDMEGSLPVFSDSGDLTPEPTRITPRGKINKIKKPKQTPRGMAL